MPDQAEGNASGQTDSSSNEDQLRNQANLQFSILCKKRSRLLDKICLICAQATNEVNESDFIVTNFNLTCNQYETVQSSLDELAIQHNFLADHDFEKINSSFQREYIQFVGKIKSTKPTVSQPRTINANHIQLERIVIPKFHGDISKYQEFHALFESLIHKNEQLSPIEKLQYLRTHLKDSALSLISNLSLSADNYLVAYQLLHDRYANTRRLAAHYINEIFEFKPCTKPDYNSLQNFLETHSNSYESLKAMKLQDLGDFILFCLCFNHLDYKTRTDFENSVKTAEQPTTRQLFQFVTERLKTLELIKPNQPHVVDSCSNKNQNKTKSFVISADNGRSLSECRAASNYSSPASSNPAFISKPLSSNYKNTSANQINQTNSKGTRMMPYQSNYKPTCFFCNQAHSIYACEKFTSLPIEEKYKEIRQRTLCFNCFGPHNKHQCKSTKACRVCGSHAHNTLLHAETKPVTIRNNEPAVVNCNIKPQENCLLGTAEIIIFDNFNRPFKARAILDSASQVTLICQSLVNKLHLNYTSSNRNLIGVGSNTSATKGEVSITISSSLKPELRLNTIATVLQNITTNHPSRSIDKNIMNKFCNLRLADPQFHISKSVDLLIGSDLFLECLSDQQPSVIKGKPGALNTHFGWLILGNLPEQECELANRTSLITLSQPISEQVQKFWEAEEIASKSPHISPNNAFCDKLFIETTTRSETGRYTVALPFIAPTPELGENRNSTMKKFLALERRLSKNETTHDRYHKFMTEYLNLDHMTLASEPSAYVIPHNYVIKESSSTTKLRVVFNASAPSNTGNSLNSILLPGPKLQNELSHILIAFRLHKIALCADIKMMYRQVNIRESDRKFQHIFYRPSPEEPVQEYELTTVVYGMVPSAYLAQKTLLQLANDHASDYPNAANVIKKFTYVDDIVTGASSIQDAENLAKELTSFMAKGGFELRKWSSNSRETVSQFPDEYLENPLAFTDDSQSIKILGFQWSPTTDSFSYSTHPFCETPTKRTILSYTAQLFDPLGLLAPVIFAFKYFLKLLWLAKLDWDTPLSPPLSDQWMNLIENIHEISTLKIPRHILSTEVNLHLIGFSDASEKGFACCIYLHVSTEYQFTEMKLIASKTRVSPVKHVSIPRLELSAAYLLTRLYEHILPAFSNVKISSVRLHTDAKIVLTWINTATYLLKTYVANRVSRILDVTTHEMWHHIPTEMNPADVASRGTTAAILLIHDIWWKGPSIYHTTPHSWPQNSCELLTEVPELKTQPIVLATVVVEKPCLLTYFEKYSKLKKAIHIFAYVLRFVNHCSRKYSTSNSVALTVEEVRESTNTLVKLTQLYYFADTLKNMQQNKPPAANLLPLSPFLDTSGILRVGGRIRHAAAKYDVKHPILLPTKCHFSTLLCDQTHSENMHAGPRTVQALILQQYWIISVRNLLRHQIRQCVKCTRFNAKPVQPIMADLPDFRVNQSPVFSHVGIDFAGPFSTKASPLRNAKTYKGYLAVFVCLSVKAVHLEYVTGLSTHEFLAAFDRFTSRRGLPAHVYTDNGLNFVGASNHLREVYNLLSSSQQEIQCHLSDRKIEWHHNVPLASNFGGIWEAVVKSAKRLLQSVIQETPYTYEEYNTLFTRIEAILNSRPTLDFSPDPNEELQLLTPGHFLIGRPLLQPIEVHFNEEETPRLKWDRIRQLTQSFWKRWVCEYLHTLSQRQRWAKKSPPIQIDQLVLVCGINSPPMSWPIGRIVALHTGKDEVARVVTVKTATGLYKRPVNRLILLPVA